MSLTLSAASIVAISAAVVGLIGLALGLSAQVRLRRLTRAYSVLQGGDGPESFVESGVRTTKAVEALRVEVATVVAGLDEVRVDLADSIRHVAVVRYDAFGDMGGRLSFSAAMLDDAGDGLVLSSINGRSETRTYAKGIKAGTCEAQLSPEEDQVIGWALRKNAPSPNASPRPASSRKQGEAL